MFKTIGLTIGLATTVFAQGTETFGIFESATDVGEVVKKGTVVFDAAKGEYRLTGGGANIWGTRDDFFFLYHKLTGDAVLTATVRFERTDGAAHRKVALMIRKSLEPGSPHVDAVVHGDGLTALQYREVADDISRTVRFPVQAPTRIRLERRGNWYTLWAGKDGQPLSEAGSVQVNIGSSVYVGLATCPHDAQGEMTTVCSDVTLENPTSAASQTGKKKQ